MAYTKVTGALVGSLSDLDLTNVGDIQLDSISGDGDTNTSITFSGSDVITIATGGSGRLTIGDGALSPVTDNQIDLGTSSLEFKDGYFDGTLYADAIDLNGTNLTAFDTDAAQTFNESGNDVDFRVESNNNADMLFVDGGNDNILLGTQNQGHVRLNQQLGMAVTGNVYGGISMATHSSSAGGNRSLLDFNRSRNTTIGSHTVVNSGDSLGTIVGRGDDGDEFLDAASIDFEVDGTPGNGDMPGRIVFATTADGASSVTERMRIDSSGRMIIGHTASISGVQNMKLQVYSNTYDGSVTLGRWTANNLGQYVNFIKSRHGTVGSNAIVQDDDVLGSIVWNADDGVNFSGRSAEIRAEIDGTPGADDLPGRLVFYTTADGSDSPTENMRITSTGTVNMTNQARMVRSLSSAQTIANSTTTTIDWANNESTVGITYSSGEFTIVEAGVYVVHAYARFQSAATGHNQFMSLHHKASGGSYAEIAYDYLLSCRGYHQMNINRAKLCAVGDVMKVVVNHNQGSSMDLTGNSASCAISVTKVA